MGVGTRPAPQVLLVDDEVVFRETLVKVLRSRGIAVTAAPSGSAALGVLAQNPVDVVVLDLKMPGMDGLEVLQAIAARHPGLPVIILTGHGTVEAGLDAVRELAFDFLLKPVPAERLVDVIMAAAETRTERA